MLITFQPAYILTPSALDDAPDRPAKRRRVGRNSVPGTPSNVSAFKFDTLLNGSEDARNVALREELFKHSWGETEGKIQVSVLNILVYNF